MAQVAPTLKRFLRQHKDAEFHSIGTDILPALYHVPARFTGWQVDLFDLYRAMDFDVALAPLADTVFNSSKSGIKAIEAMALSIPVIASDMEPYRGIIKQGVNGFLVRRQHEWMKYLRELANDPDLRDRMGTEGRRTAAHLTIQEGWKRWETAYAGTMTKGGVRCV